MKKAKVALVSMLMLAGSGVYAQTDGIGGTVTDNTGEPIIGASVKVKEPPTLVRLPILTATSN